MCRIESYEWISLAINNKNLAMLGRQMVGAVLVNETTIRRPRIAKFLLLMASEIHCYCSILHIVLILTVFKILKSVNY